jgi:hypothetical protein
MIVVAGSVDQCRSERTSRHSAQRWVPTSAFVLFILGFWATSAYVKSVPVAATFDDVVQFDLWTFLLGGLMGFGLASGVYFVVWLIGLMRLCDKIRVWTALSWLAIVAIVLATVFAFLFAGTASFGDSVDKSLATQARPITVLAALSQLPGLIAFLALRFVARQEAHWQESGACRLRLVLRLRAELQRLLATLGAFLTLLVVVAGMRRRALLALDPDQQIPPEVVLLYGLVFAVILGLFSTVADGAIDRRAELLLDEFTPLPDPSDAALSDKLRTRNDLASLTGGGGTWRTFQTTVVIAAPLLTALIGSAIGD